MTTLPRILTLLLCAGLSGLAHGDELIRECPSSLTAYSGGSNDPSELYWDINGGTLSGALNELAEFVFGALIPPGSSCVIDGRMSFFDIHGNQLDTKKVIIDNAGTMLVMERDFQPNGSTREYIRYAVNGTATGCTVEEAASFTPIVSHLKSKSGNDCSGTGCAETKTSMRLYPSYFVHGTHIASTTPDYIANAEPPLRLVDLQCRASAKKIRPLGDRVLVTRIEDEETSQSVEEDSELVISASPRLFRPSCPEASAYYRTKIKLSFKYVAADNNGNTISDTIVLDKTNPLTTVSLPYLGSGERSYWKVSSSAQVEGCSSAQPADLSVNLNQYNIHTGETLTSRPLRGVSYKLPPEIADGDEVSLTP
jgi:hypothetical protein